MISILLPVYNGFEFLNESVLSVIEQTFTDWELLIGINGHPENSHYYQIAKQFEDYQAYQQKIRVFDLYKIQGKANTLNELVKHCRYDYVALIDVDDIWMPNKLEIQQPFLHRYDVIGAKCIYFGDKNGIIPEIPEGDITKFDFTKLNPIINSSVIIRKRLCFWMENNIEDYDLWLRLRQNNYAFYNCREILVKHRIHQQSAFNAKGNNNLVPNLLAKYTC